MGARRLQSALVFSSVVTLFGVYAWLLDVVPGVGLVLVAIAAWHTIENDMALPDTYANGLRAAAVPRGARRHLVALGVTGVGVAVAAFVRSGWLGPHLAFADLFAAVVFYHVVSWLVVMADRVAGLEGGARRALLSRLACVHLPPAAACAALSSAGSAPGSSLFDGDGFWLEHASIWVLSPGVYAFWSALHVLQTLVSRGWRRDQVFGARVAERSIRRR